MNTEKNEYDFTIWGRGYAVYEFAVCRGDNDMWLWSTDGEESAWFASAVEAQQDAMRHVRDTDAQIEEDRIQDLEDEAFGSYEDQVRSLYYSNCM